MGAFTMSTAVFPAAFTVTALDGQYVVTVNGIVKYAGPNPDVALRAVRRFGPRRRYDVISRREAGLDAMYLKS